ncbi:porin [Neoehrlichia mikurensis]|uniref:Porin n=1 Tax=Neoehrlichia mikurensis TaxID=89586 RepID=A0A9Q9BSJ5_9RICK|nr:porin [Neoehrlichia mikurensis]UTO55467.1 porin [Neoehrlichia mikurensis]UTO56387.1 porin [Neoehrlichia mikurensis]
MRIFIVICIFIIFLFKESVFARQSNYDDAVIKNNTYINYQKLRKVHKGSKISIYGSTLSYVWITDKLLRDKYEDNDVYELYNYNSDANSDNWGVNNDALLSVNIMSQESNGFLYGARFQLLMPAIQGRISLKKISNRGVIGFINFPYGNLSLGYQEGVESEMKADAFSIAAGDQGIEWSRYVSDFFVKKDNTGVPVLNNIPCYWSSGLYSENLYRSNGNFVIRDNMLDNKDFINNLPFRISYKSADIFGINVGISYSPLGYKDSLLSNDSLQIIQIYDNLNVRVGELKGIPVTIVVKNDSYNDNTAEKKLTFTNAMVNIKEIPISYNTRNVIHKIISESMNSYKNIISGAVTYNYKVNDIKFIGSLVGEYAKSDNSKKIILNDLIGVALGTNIEYNRLKFGAAYGYLGKSGSISYVDNDEGRRFYNSSSSYYWDIGVNYRYNGLSISLIYFDSSYGCYADDVDGKKNRNFLKDFSIGLDYDLYSNNTTRCKLFANYHYFTISQELSKLKSAVHGGVLLSGMRVEF